MGPGNQTVTRLRRYVSSIAARYPHAWDQLTMFRQDKAQLGGWPSWCDVPIAGGYAIASGGNRMTRSEQLGDAAAIAGVGAWRLTQGVYRYDPDLLDALWTTPARPVTIHPVED